MVLVGGSAWAADFDLSGYTLHKTYDFSGYTTETAIEIGSAVTTKCWDNGNGQLQTMYPVTSPTNMEGLIVQSKANKGFIIGANSGFYSKGAARCAGIEGLSKGDLVVLTATQNIDNVISLIKTHSKGNNLPDGNYNFTKSNDGKVYYCAMTDDGYLGYHNLNGKQAISKIEIYKPNEGTNIANYTVKFVDGNGVDLLDAKTYSGAVGMQCNVFPADLQNITNNNIGYLVESNNASEKTIAADGSTVVTVTFAAVAPVAYTVNELSGEKIFRTTTGEAYTGSTIKVPYRYYNVADSLLYKKDATNREFNYSFNLTQENQSENLSYTATGTKGIVFISEGEDIEGLTPCNSNNTAIRSSNSSSAYATEDTKIVTLAEGKYKIYTVIYDASKEPNSHWIFKAGAVEVADLNCTTVNFQELNSTEFAVGRETDIIMAKGGSNTMGLDLIYIQKTGDVNPEEAEALNAAADSIAAIVAAKAAFQADITAAKAIDTIGKNGAEELAAAITAAEEAYAAEDATVESIQTAKAALAAAVSAFNKANRPDLSNIIANADFASLENWTALTSASFHDQGNGLIGEYKVCSEFDAATVDETHLATEYCIGVEARWASSFASYTQETAELPAGEYMLMFDVENVNGGTSKAAYENLFTVTVGEAVSTDTFTEWMDGKSAWTTHGIKFALTETGKATISLGYGTGENNFALANTPALFISHLSLVTAEEGDSILKAIEDAKAAAEKAKNEAELAANIEKLQGSSYANPSADLLVNGSFDTANEGWSLSNMGYQANQERPTRYVEKWQPGALTGSGSATQTIKNLPAGAYLLKGTAHTNMDEEADGAQLSVNDSVVVVSGAWKEYEILYNLSDAGDITVSFSFNNIASNWVAIDEFSLVYGGDYDQYIADKNKPDVDPNDYTDLIVNADLTNTETKGWDETETKGIDGSGIVKVGSGKNFDFNQTIANLPAGKYKVTAQAAYRYSDGEAREADSIAAGVNTKFAKLYATVGTTTVDTLVQNRYDGASETNLFNGEGGVSVVNEKYVPNSSDAVKAWFAAGKYVNEVVFNLPADGAVTIGIVKTQSPEESDYTVIGPWTLTRLGDAEVEPEPQPEPQPQPGDDMTKYITNPSFETGDLTGWTVGNSADTGVKPNSNGTYTTEGCDGDYVFNTWWQGIPITQTVKGLPNGLYELKALMANDAITAGNQPCLYLLANGQHSAAFSSPNAGTFAEGSMQFYVTDGTATIGAIGGNADGTFNEAGYYWYKADNFRLKYVEAMPNIEDVEIPEGKMSIAAANAMTAAKEAGDVVALIQAVNNAKSSIAAYAHVKEVLDFVAEEAAKTNVYTAAAKEKFDSICTATLKGYNEGTISDADANAFNIGSRLGGLIPELFLSAYTSTVEGTPYINTWSVEGNTDGSEFRTPFYEYWVGDNDALAANTITAKVEGLTAGEYDVTAWVRVRIKNGAEAPAAGITMQANDGEAVDVAAGDQVGTSQMYLKEFTATGTVAEDGELKIKFNVAAENNISWLSFKNVKFEKKPVKPEAIEGALYSWESPEGLPGEYGGTISYENGDGDRLNYKNGDYYTICLNGKKANMNETASANAGYMLVTLDEALTEGDTIFITAYINKNASKNSSAYILFDNGADVESEIYSDEANIDPMFNGVPTEKSIIVTEAMAGAKSFKMTRGQTGTNLFITKFVIMKGEIATGISTVKSSNLNGTIFNLNGQKVNKAQKGMYIINGKKVVIK